jgi:hypothetical protein
LTLFFDWFSLLSAGFLKILIFLQLPLWPLLQMYVRVRGGRREEGGGRREEGGGRREEGGGRREEGGGGGEWQVPGDFRGRERRWQEAEFFLGLTLLSAPLLQLGILC